MNTAGTQPCAPCATLEPQLAQRQARVAQLEAELADGKLLTSDSNDKTICLWDAQTHKQFAVIRPGSIVYSAAFSPDGTRLAAGYPVRLFWRRTESKSTAGQHLIGSLLPSFFIASL